MGASFERRVELPSRFEPLLALTTALSAASDPAGVAEAGLAHLLEAIGAVGGLMLFRESRGLGARREGQTAYCARPTVDWPEESWTREALTAARWMLEQGDAPSGGPPERASVCVPLALGASRLAAVYLEVGEAPIGERELEVLDAFSRVIAQALDAALERRDAQERLGQFEMLNQLYHSVAKNFELEKVIAMALQMAMDLVKAERALVLLLEDGQLSFAAGRDQAGPLEAVTESAVSRSACQKALESEQGVFVFDTDRDDEFASRYSIRDLRLKAVIAVPLIGRTGPIGVMYVDSRTEMQGALEQELSVLTAIAGQASILIENARLFRQATVDGLTGLYIRAYFMNRLEEEVRRVLRYGGACSLLLFDLDHFKRLNDTYGHQTGDQALKLVSRIIAGCLRTGIDLPGRFGGEEILVLLPETDAAGALVVAERVRAQIAEARLQGPAGEVVQVTTSIGVASLPHMASSAHDLFARADEALYRAKGEGRNRVTVYRP
ncbi:MAG: diguanylate cyclase [Candidatus Sericytochromatia bacterium]